MTNILNKIVPPQKSLHLKQEEKLHDSKVFTNLTSCCFNQTSLTIEHWRAFQTELIYSYHALITVFMICDEREKKKLYKPSNSVELFSGVLAISCTHYHLAFNVVILQTMGCDHLEKKCCFLMRNRSKRKIEEKSGKLILPLYTVIKLQFMKSKNWKMSYYFIKLIPTIPGWKQNIRESNYYI